MAADPHGIARPAQHPSVKPRPGPDSRWPGCCGYTGVCQVTDPDFCMYVNHKRYWNRVWAALPRCVECGECEETVRHKPMHPEYHPFATEAASA